MSHATSRLGTLTSNKKTLDIQHKSGKLLWHGVCNRDLPSCNGQWVVAKYAERYGSEVSVVNFSGCSGVLGLV